LNSINETVKAIRTFVSLYYSLKNDSIDFYEYTGPDFNSPSPIELNVVHYLQVEKNPDLMEVYETYNITPTDLGPFDANYGALQEFFSDLIQMSADFHIYTVLFNPNDQIYYLWKVTQTYDFTFRGGKIALSLLLEKHIDQVNRGSVARYIFQFWNNICIIILSIVSQYISFTAISRAFVQFQQVFGEKYGIGYIVEWKKVNWRTKIKFLNTWFIVTVIGNFFNTLAAILGLLELTGFKDDATGDVINGFGCMMAWVNMTRYFEYNYKYYLLILALRRCTLNILRFLISIFPVLLGFSFFGLSVFCIVYRFGDHSNVMATLFSFINKDEMLGTFKSIFHVNQIASRVYLYSVVLIFTYVTLNIFIFIVHDAYEFATQDGQNIAKENKKIEKNPNQMSMNDVYEITLNTDVWKDFYNDEKKDASLTKEIKADNFLYKPLLLNQEEAPNLSPKEFKPIKKLSTQDSKQLRQIQEEIITILKVIKETHTNIQRAAMEIGKGKDKNI